MTKKYSLEILEQVKKAYSGNIIAFKIINEIESYGDEWYSKMKIFESPTIMIEEFPRIYHTEESILFHDEHEYVIDEAIDEYLENSGGDFADLVRNFNFDGYDINSLKCWKVRFSFRYAVIEMQNFINKLN